MPSRCDAARASVVFGFAVSLWATGGPATVVVFLVAGGIVCLATQVIGNFLVGG